LLVTQCMAKKEAIQGTICPCLCKTHVSLRQSFADGESMREDLFLKSALHSLSSPGQLDALQRLTPMRAWIALAAIFLFLAAVLAWSVYGSLPVTVSGQGILIREGGVFNVMAAGE